MKVTHKLEVCDDCAHVLASGVESEAHERAAELMTEQWGLLARHIVLTCEHCDHGFVWGGTCGGCRQDTNTLHPAAVLGND
jgi:hypothetical protein